MSETFDHDLKKSMRQTLRLISEIQKARWRLIHDEVYGWGFKGEHGGYYDGADDAPWSRIDGQEDDIHAAWEAINKPDDPRDVELMRQIREQIRAKAEGPRAG
jgi:hypothetical protein